MNQQYDTSMMAQLRELWQFRELLHTMVQRELKIRYKNSFLGFLWSLINPLLTILTLTYIFRGKTNNYSAYALAAYIPFSFLSMSIVDATGSILNTLPMVKKIYFPREIMPLASIISNFIHFMLSMVVFFVFLTGIYILHPGQSPFQWTTVYLPFLMLISLLFATGCGLAFSAWNAFFEDVKYIVQFGMSMLFFLSPIMYMVEDRFYTDGPHIYKIYTYLNPIGIICNAFRKTLLAAQPVNVNGVLEKPIGIEWVHIGYAAGVSVVVFFWGYRVFNKHKWRFVERP